MTTDDLHYNTEGFRPSYRQVKPLIPTNLTVAVAVEMSEESVGRVPVLGFTVDGVEVTFELRGNLLDLLIESLPELKARL